MSRMVLVVGDKFSEFATTEHVMTMSRLISLFDSGASLASMPTEIVIGQGVSGGALAYLVRRAASRGVLPQIISGEHVERRTGRRFSHKHQLQNVLVTDPVRMSDSRYGLLLSIDERCEIMSDHTTGAHVQGMLLIEAARQSFLAVSEWFLLPPGRNFYFVINRFHTEFKRFAFPVPTRIELETRNVRSRKGDRVSADTLIEIFQCDEVVCQCEVSFSAFDHGVISQREHGLAADVAHKVLAACEADAMGGSLAA